MTKAKLSPDNDMDVNVNVNVAMSQIIPVGDVLFATCLNKILLNTITVTITVTVTGTSRTEVIPMFPIIPCGRRQLGRESLISGPGPAEGSGKDTGSGLGLVFLMLSCSF